MNLGDDVDIEIKLPRPVQDRLLGKTIAVVLLAVVIALASHNRASDRHTRAEDGSREEFVDKCVDDYARARRPPSGLVVTTIGTAVFLLGLFGAYEAAGIGLGRLVTRIRDQRDPAPPRPMPPGRDGA